MTPKRLFTSNPNVTTVIHVNKQRHLIGEILSESSHHASKKSQLNKLLKNLQNQQKRHYYSTLFQKGTTAVLNQHCIRRMHSSRAMTTKTNSKKIVDLRSDTVTSPSSTMLQTALNAKTGDDVMKEDPTVQELEEYTAHLFGKECGLYVPTGTMGNLISIISHCHADASAAEVIIGKASHLCNYEGGNISTLGGIGTRQIEENECNGEFDIDDIRDVCRTDNDDHYAKTKLLCLENTHNMLGGIALTPHYINSTISKVVHDELDIKLHIDGARIMNSIVAHDVPPSIMCQNVDSISICLSKGLGAPMGTVVVGAKEFIRLARRARKRCGGGMRQVGVIAAMGLHALQNNVSRLVEDHVRAKRLYYG